MKSRTLSRGAASLLSSSICAVLVAACTSSSSGTPGPAGFDGGSTDGGGTLPDTGTSADGGNVPDSSPEVDASTGTDASDTGVVLPPGAMGPIPYLSRADSPFTGVVFPMYDKFEDWETHALTVTGVTADSTTLSSSFGAALIDSVDGDDGKVDGVCAKQGDTCDAAFANGTITFTFDEQVLGALPTHVGIVWTDGATGCDAIFEAYDAADTMIGTKTAPAIGDSSNQGTVAEDRWFGMVAPGGVKKIVVKSSSGGVEVDNLELGR